MTARSVTVYPRRADGRWAVGVDAAAPGGEVCGEVRCPGSASAAVIARKLNEALAELAGDGGPLVLPREEFDARQHIRGVLTGKEKTT